MILFRKIVNIGLATLLLVATTGVTLNKHYCMGRLKSVAINDPVTRCCEEEAEKMPCCEDISEKLKVEEITQVSFDFDANPDLYPLALLNFILSDFELISLKQKTPKYRDHSPPLIDRDLRVKHQVFII